MNKAELAALEAELAHPYSGARISHQGRLVSFHTVMVSPLRFAIQVYVGGSFKGAWCSAKTPCPEQLYLRRMDRPLHKPAELKGIKRVLGAKKFAEMQARRWVWFSGVWPSAKTLCRHLAKACPDAVLVYPQLPGAADPAAAALTAATLSAATPPAAQQPATAGAAL